ncbi:MAG: hypothetical protein QNJ54_34850 [Prochloraceae cyanobacterium]|nr:hypothetical protein [Prochloraceae cyanobacterium]
MKIHHQLALAVLVSLISLSSLAMGLRRIENQIRAKLGQKVLTVATQILN